MTHTEIQPWLFAIAPLPGESLSHFLGRFRRCNHLTPIGDKLRLKASCQGDFRWWLNEKRFSTADSIWKGRHNQLDLRFSLSFDNP
jgi:hypothetical protein